MDLLKKIKAYTLVEVMVAMSIILIVFAIALMIMTNVLKSDKLLDITKAKCIINEMYFDIENGVITNNEDIDYKGYNVQISRNHYNGSENLIHWMVSVSKEKTLILEKQFIKVMYKK